MEENLTPTLLQVFVLGEVKFSLEKTCGRTALGRLERQGIFGNDSLCVQENTVDGLGNLEGGRYWGENWGYTESYSDEK